ncbi:hypothetical protein ABZ714_30505, partial [Streptomyces sp. NPDC006798]
MSDRTPFGRPPADWHVDPATAAAYARGSVREPDAWSVEKHIESCSRCAAAVSAAVRAVPAAATALAEVRSALLTRIASAEGTDAVRPPGPETVPHPAETFAGSPTLVRRPETGPGSGTSPLPPAAAGARPKAPDVPTPGLASAMTAPPAAAGPTGRGAGSRRTPAPSGRGWPRSSAERPSAG